MNLDKLTPKQTSALITLLLELRKEAWVEVSPRHAEALGRFLEEIPQTTQQGVTYFNRSNDYWWFSRLEKDVILYITDKFK